MNDFFTKTFMRLKTVPNMNNSEGIFFYSKKPLDYNFEKIVTNIYIRMDFLYIYIYKVHTYIKFNLRVTIFENLSVVYNDKDGMNILCRRPIYMVHKILLCFIMLK